MLFFGSNKAGKRSVVKHEISCEQQPISKEQLRAGINAGKWLGNGVRRKKPNPTNAIVLEKGLEMMQGDLIAKQP